MSFFWNIPASIKSFLKYAFVWCIGTGIDIALVYLLVVRLGYTLYFWTLVAFVVAATNNFILNKFWTFHDTGGRYKRQYMKFLMVSIMGLILTLFCMGILVEFFGLPIIISKLLTSWIVLSWNFLANKYWTFASALTLQYIPSAKQYPLFLTIIVPVYNESRRIEHTLSLLEAWRQDFSQPTSVEILLVNDGSIDTTWEIIRSHFPAVRLVELEKNIWKWWAVAQWVYNAFWQYSLIFDADSSTPISEIEKFLPRIHEYEFIIGSRYTEESNVIHKQNHFRRFISRMGNILIQAILIDGIRDTQCGFKLFETDKWRAIFERQKILRWWFDIEMLFLARAFWFRILEIGVVWNNDTNSRFRAIRDSGRTFFELLSIKFFAWFGGYK